MNDLNIFLVIFLYVFLFIIDGYPVMKGYKKCSPPSYLIIFFTAFSLSILTSLRIKVPSPAKGIENIILFIIGK